MPNVNQVVIVGHLTRDAEKKFLPSGSSVTSFGIAVNHKYGEKEEVCFVDVACFGWSADHAATLRKGQVATVVGRLAFDQWEKDGQKRSKHKIVAFTVVPGAMAGERKAEPAAAEPKPISDDDIPF